MTTTKETALRRAGQLAAEIHQEVGALLKPGLNLLKIESHVAKRIADAGMKPAFLGFKGYTAATCLSVNDEIVHGIPHDYELENGDVLKVDLGVTSDGWMVDTARTHIAGTGSPQTIQLLKITEHALNEAIKVARVGNHTGDIGAIVEKIIISAGFSVIRDLTGHGVNPTLQEAPSIPNYGYAGSGAILKEGMVLAIEPITSLKPTEIAILADGWTIIAENGLATAQFEHTILITDKEPIVLTALAR